MDCEAGCQAFDPERDPWRVLLLLFHVFSSKIPREAPKDAEPIQFNSVRVIRNPNSTLKAVRDQVVRCLVIPECQLSIGWGCNKPCEFSPTTQFIQPSDRHESATWDLVLWDLVLWESVKNSSK